MVVQGGAAEIPETIFAEDRRIGAKLAFIERGGRCHDLESRTRFHHIDDGAVFHFLGLRFGATIQIEIRAISYREDFARLRPHQNNRSFLRSVLLHRGVDFVLHNVLQTKIDSKMDLVAVARRTLLSSIRHDLLANAVVLDEAITVLSMKVFFHRSFHALNTVMFEVGESDDVTKHRAIRVNTRGVMLEMNSTQTSDAEFFAQRGR